MTSAQGQYNELALYTLAHNDPAFIHQHVVDAFAAQCADEATKPIALVFALMGLYLHVEKGYTGRQVQRAHMQMAKHRKQWTRPPLVDDRGPITAVDVVSAAPGPERDAMIHAWCGSVWAAWVEVRAEIVELARTELDVH